MVVTKEKTPGQIAIGLTSYDGELSKNETQGKYSTFREMRKDPTIALARQLVIAPILASSWSVERKEGVEDEIVDFIDDQLSSVRLHLLETAMLGCIDFGWQGFEKVFTVNEDGRIAVSKLKPLLQDYTKILVEIENGAYAGLRQDNTASIPIILRAQETLLFNVNVEGTYWYGEPILEAVRDPYEKWVEVEKAAAKYDKKIAGSHWVIHYPPGTSKVNGVDTDNFVVAKNVINSLEASGTIAIPRTVEGFLDTLNVNAPDAWKVELISATGISGTALTERQKYLDALKVRAFGVPERAILEGQFGTKAEAEAHADLAIVAMEIRHKNLIRIINWHLVNQLVRLNFGKGYENRVYVEPAPLVDLALQFLRDIYKNILSSPEGFLLETDTIDKEALKDRLGIPVNAESNVDYSENWRKTYGNDSENWRKTYGNEEVVKPA